MPRSRPSASDFPAAPGEAGPVGGGERRIEGVGEAAVVVGGPARRLVRHGVPAE